MKSKKILFIASGLIVFLLLTVVAFVLIVNLKEASPSSTDGNNVYQSNLSGQTDDNSDQIDDVEVLYEVAHSFISEADVKLNTRKSDLIYVSLTELQNFFNVKHSLDGNNPVLIIDKKNITFDLSSNDIHYEKKKAFKDHFVVEQGEIFIPISFINKHYDDVHTFETLVGIKLTAFKHIPILLYHTVNDSENNTLNTNPEHFEDHIKRLSEVGYTGITPFDLYEFYYENGRLPDKPVFINFDDGYKDNFTDAFPILQKYNMKATIFIIASRIAHEGINNYPTEIPKLTWEDAILMKDLVTIQNHTWDSHRKIKAENGKDIGQIAAPQLKPDNTYETKEEYIARITHDISSGQNIIKEKLGYESVVFSYPYGEYSQEVINVFSDFGVKLGVSVAQGKPMHVEHLFTINRMVIDGNWNGKHLIKEIEKHYK